jgi:hypothetical protein
MGKKHTVGESESLAHIARKHKHRTEKPILAANPKLAQMCANNTDVLPPNLTLAIPELAPRCEAVPTEAEHFFELKAALRKDLVLTLQAPDGAAFPEGTYELSYQDEKGKTVQKKGNLEPSIRVEDWPPTLTEAELRVTLRYNARAEEKAIPERAGGPSRPHHFELIQLHVGALDPIVGSPPDRVKAVQKILTNLGYYSGEPDGVLGKLSRAAIMKFQYLQGISPSHSELLDAETIRRLKEIQDNPIGASTQPVAIKAHDRDKPLEVPKDAKCSVDTEDRVEWLGPSECYYLDPRDEDQGKRQPFQDAQYFPSEAYVATSDHGTSTNKNVIRMKSRRFIFLDTGYWMSYARNFSVILGPPCLSLPVYAGTCRCFI